MNRDFRFKPKGMAKELEIKDIIDWCYGDGAKATDFIMTEWLLDALPTLYQQDEKIYEYNQFSQSWSKKSCTLFSPIGAISDLYNVEIALDTIKEWDADSYNHGRRKWEWWWLQLGVDHICNCWNNSKYWEEYGKVAYYSIDIRDNKLVKWVLDKRYTICTWYNWNAKYNNDKNADWILNGKEFGASTYWHAINLIWWIDTPSRVKDNYKGSKYNIYGVEHEISEIPCFFNRWFVITKVKEDNMEEIKRLNELKSKVILAIETNSEIRHLVNDKNYQSILHYTNDKNRRKLTDIDEQLAKYV